MLLVILILYHCPRSIQHSHPCQTDTCDSTCTAIGRF
uniref:Uncharacterized protein n=1 Tax=Arundo donax TaxID=35708 RepID=A0A0A8ZVQ8_ARUDO